MNINDLHNIIRVLRNHFEKDQRVLLAFIFGSSAKKESATTNDLDLAILYESQQVPSGLDILKEISKLSDLTGKEVDLAILNTANPFLRHQVMKPGIAVIVKDPETYRKFREQTIIDYDEYKYVSGLHKYD